MLSLCLVLFSLAIGPVTLWSGETVPRERVGGVTDQGIEVRQGSGAGEVGGSTLVPWGRVRSIGNGWEGARSYESIADAIARAESRLARGDAAGAGWLLEPLAERYFGASGPTTSQIASALIMVRLMDDDRAGAMEAWLVWYRDRGGPARGWLDQETGLCPSLPPVFTPEPAPPTPPSSGGEPLGVMEGLYRVARAGARSGTRDGLGSIARSPRDRADPGIRWVWDIVRASGDPDPAGRRSARAAIDRRGRPEGDWRAAWAHLGVGVSLLGEPDRRSADAGAARLISVIIEHPRAAPGLTALARDLLIGYFESTGRPGHAESVRGMDRAALLGLEPGLRAGADETEDRGVTTEPPPAERGLPRENP